jgi:proline dehydrogenase
MDWISILKGARLLSPISTLGMKTGIAKRFVAGEGMEEALEKTEELNRKGILVTLDLLGENVDEKVSARKVSDNYCKLLEEIQKRNLKANISVKLTHLGLDIDRKICMENLEEILMKAESVRNFVRIDMEGSRYTRETLEMFCELWRSHKNVGVVIQSMLKRSCEDVQKLIHAGATVRLVKGAYREPPHIAYQNIDEIRKNFIQLMEKLLSEGNYPAVATHDALWSPNGLSGRAGSRWI